MNYFTIVACDSFDNECPAGGADFKVAVPEHAVLQGFKDQGNGKYSGAYKLKPTATPGMRLEIGVTLGEGKDGQPKHIKGSPFRMAVQAYGQGLPS